MWSLWARIQCGVCGLRCSMDLWARIQCGVCGLGCSVEFVG
jgi:hypothetical protein